MITYKIKNITNKDIFNIYFKANGISFIISETFIICLLYDKFPIYIQLIILIANFYLTGHQFIANHRVIYQIDISEKEQYITLYYFVLFRNKKEIPFQKLHAECIIANSPEDPKYNMKINFRINSFPIGYIELKRNYVPASKNWTKEQIIEISQKLYEIKQKYPTYKKDIWYSRWQYGWERVDKFKKQDNVE